MQSTYMDKWSSKPSDHNAIRVRNNQRRHRARVKDHIEDLEKRLDETNTRLEAALSKIASLKSELEVLRGHQPVSSSHASSQSSPPRRGSSSSSMHTRSDDAETFYPAFHQPLPPENAFVPSPHSQTVAVVESDGMGGSTDICNCEGLPPPAAGESTVPCGSAFQIIEQQNFSGIEVTKIRAWLGPGFRTSPIPGGPCRVETNLLYQLLDHITSSS